jgi:hypothetical protein
MAGSATITGKQHYTLGIGHPKSEPLQESPPAVLITNSSNVIAGVSNYAPTADQVTIQSLFGDVTSKVIAKQDANNWYMAAPKSGGRSTGLIYVIGKGKALGDSGASSVGGAGDAQYSLFRVVQVIESIIALGCHHTPSGTSGTWTGPTQWTVPGSASGFGLGAWNAIKYYDSTVQNSYNEYSITVGDSGKFSVGFLVGSGRATGVKVTLDTVDIDTFSTVASSTAFWSKEYTASPGTHTVRVTKTDAGAGPLQIIGCNCYYADRFPVGNSIDAMGYARTANRYKFTSTGAIEYAMQGAGTGKFAGSFHGGETAVSQVVSVDGADVTASANGTVLAGLDIKFVQDTLVDTTVGTVSIQSTTQFRQAGGHSFYASADFGTTPLSFMYTHMDVLELGFSALAYPLTIDFTGYANNSEVPIGATEITIMRNPTTGQQAATWSRQQVLDYNKYSGARVWCSAGNYFKPYNGPVVDYSAGTTLGKLGWSSMHAYF